MLDHARNVYAHIMLSGQSTKSKVSLMLVFLLHQPCKLTLTADRALGRHSRVPQPDCYRHTKSENASQI